MVNKVSRLVWLLVGVAIGGGGVGLGLSQTPTVRAGTADRFEDYVMCTGSTAVNPRAPTDGVWLLDHRAGKLLGTVVDRNIGKVMGWAEVDLVGEFGLPPGHQAHFLMTTGQISQTQAALYVAETSSGKFGVYTMGPRGDGKSGIAIVRHDLAMFRQSP